MRQEILELITKVPDSSWPAGVAELLEGHLARELDSMEHHWTTSRHNNGLTVFSATRKADPFRLGEGPTRLQALADACLGIRKRRVAVGLSPDGLETVISDPRQCGGAL